MLEIFFVNLIFKTLQKKSFGQKKIWISCTGLKVPFWQFFISGKLALLNSCMEFKIFFWPKDFFWSVLKMTFEKNISVWVRQIQDLGQSGLKTEIFSKRTHKISKLLFNFGPCEDLARLESKIRKRLFFDGSLL